MPAAKSTEKLRHAVSSVTAAGSFSGNCDRCLSPVFTYRFSDSKGLSTELFLKKITSGTMPVSVAIAIAIYTTADYS
jgi:hypothetical protein